MTKVKVAEFQKRAAQKMSTKAFTCSLTRYIIEEKNFWDSFLAFSNIEHSDRQMNSQKQNGKVIKQFILQ